MAPHLQWKVKNFLELEVPLCRQKQKPYCNKDIQQDYDYFMAQKVAEKMLSDGLISLSEFNKLTQINRDTFSPFLAEIMPKIT